MCGCLNGGSCTVFCDALDLEGFGIVERLDFGIVDRRAFDGGVEHAGALGVHAEDGLAGDDVVLVDRGDVLADVAVLFGLLEAQIGFGGNGKRGGDDTSSPRLALRLEAA